MIVETEIYEAVRQRIADAAPEIGGRVASGALQPTDARDWPCVRIQMSRTNIETRGNTPGRRLRACRAALNISIVADGNVPGIDAKIREIGQAIDEALMAEPYLEDASGKARISDLYLASTAAEHAVERGVVLAVRQLIYGIVCRTRETDPRETLSR